MSAHAVRGIAAQTWRDGGGRGVVRRLPFDEVTSLLGLDEIYELEQRYATPVRSRALMGMTMAEKILASRSGADVVTPGQYVWADVDGTGIFGPVPWLDQLGITKVYDKARVYAVDDHFAPSPTVERADAHQALKDFARRFELENYFEYGRHGILHQLFPEHGYVSPGDLIVSVDSHSTSYGCFNALGTPIIEELPFVVITGQIWLRVPPTIRFDLVGELPPWCVGKDVMLKITGDHGTDCAVYKSVEFMGPVVSQLSLGSRFTMSNMGVEIGAKCAIFEADDDDDGVPRRAHEAATDAGVARSRRRLRGRAHRRRDRPRTDGRAAPRPVEHAPGVGGRRARSDDRPGVPRLVHERTCRGHRHGGADPRRPHPCTRTCG